MLDQWIRANADDVQVVVFFSLFAVLAIVEILAPRRPGPAERRTRWVANLLLTALNITVMSLLPVTFLGVAVWSQERNLGLLNQFAMPLGLLIVATLLCRGFISFFTHLLMHKVPLFWRVHRVHHLDTELDVSTTVRFHPLEFGLSLAVGVPLVALFGLSPWILLTYEILDAGVTVFSHANVHLPRGIDRVLRYVVVTPDLHRVHHSSWQPETDSNYSAVFPIWDLVFGTFRTDTREPHEVMELGLEEVRDGRQNRLLWLLGSPVRRLESEREEARGGK